MDRKSYLIFGVSKGLGKALTKHLPSKDDVVYGISRTEPDYLKEFTNINWIKANLSEPINSAEIVKSKISDEPIDYIIYNVGIWERDGFTDDYSFAESTHAEIVNLINVNVSSCILALQGILTNLKKSRNPKIVLIGSTWGLDNHNGSEVAFSASKFALRGVVHSLRNTLADSSIGISILNLGTLATEYEIEDGTQVVLDEFKGACIPLSDVIQAIKFVISTTNASCVKEINMPAMKDENI
ncbi:MAG: SDR family oxidoreductase [Cyclobacteriaceae bacterium]|nr:SDR family oxidoreductase [Cyclobacteriaceae bacterium HetDA_MAG_MS6]